MAPSATCVTFSTLSKVFLVILLNIGGGVSQCPDQSIAFNHACYEFSTVEMGYFQAKEYCESRDGRLAMPKTIPVDAYIIGILQYGGYLNGYWIGIEAGFNAEPVWSDGTAVSACPHSAWAPGAPAYTTSRFSRMPQQCAFIDPANHFLWNTGNCLEQKRFICQVGAGDQADCSGERQDISQVSDGRCGGFFLVEDAGGFPGGCEPTGPSPCCSADGQCGNTELHCDCPECKDYGLMMLPDCPAGYYRLKDTCYGAKSTPSTYQEARVTCAADGGTLAMPKHLHTDFFLIGLMLRESPEEYFWIGLNDIDWEYNHVFDDGTKLADCAFQKWLSGPMDRAHFRNCVYYYYHDSHGYFWRDLPCNERNGFLCQIGPGITENCENAEAETVTRAPPAPWAPPAPEVLVVRQTTRSPPRATTTTHTTATTATATTTATAITTTTVPPSLPATRPPVKGPSTAPAWTEGRPKTTPPPLPPAKNTFMPNELAAQQGTEGPVSVEAAVGGTAAAVAGVGVGVGVGALVYKKVLLTKVVPLAKG